MKCHRKCWYFRLHDTIQYVMSSDVSISPKTSNVFKKTLNIPNK